MRGGHTILTSARCVVGEIRPFDIRFAICRCHILAIMSDSSTAENDKEFTEMQKVTLLLHMMEHLVFPDAKLTREIKLKTIDSYA